MEAGSFFYGLFFCGVADLNGHGDLDIALSFNPLLRSSSDLEIS